MESAVCTAKKEEKIGTGELQRGKIITQRLVLVYIYIFVRTYVKHFT
jgi:hypothetical protein